MRHKKNLQAQWGRPGYMDVESTLSKGASGSRNTSRPHPLVEEALSGSTNHLLNLQVESV